MKSYSTNEITIKLINDETDYELPKNVIVHIHTVAKKGDIANLSIEHWNAMNECRMWDGPFDIIIGDEVVVNRCFQGLIEVVGIPTFENSFNFAEFKSFVI